MTAWMRRQRSAPKTAPSFRAIATLVAALLLPWPGMAAEIALRLEDGSTAPVARVVLSNGQASIAIDLADGAMRRMANSPSLSGIPNLGSLAGDTYPSEALGPETRIGAAWRDGALLFLVVDEPLVRLQSLANVTLFNDRWSYRLLGQPQPYDLDIGQDIAAFGAIPTVQRWLRLLPEPDDVRLLTVGVRRNPIGLLSPGARAREDVEALRGHFVGVVHRSQQQLGVVIYPSEAIQ